MKTMNRRLYTHFVRPNSPTQPIPALQQRILSGIEAKKLYLEEVKEVKDPVPAKETLQQNRLDKKTTKRKACPDEVQYCEKEIFLSVQNNDIVKLIQILDAFPDKINLCDGFGWSLLMIACQANAVDVVKELLERGIDICIRDSAGNSARSLVIKSRNYILADILLGHKSHDESKEIKAPNNCIDEYICDICNNKKFLNKQHHLSSTLHNINASKGRKIPTNYAIPESNKGYQIMLRGGWDKEAGLGPDGSGKKYPVKATKKLDKTGLGHKKKTIETILNEEQEKAKSMNLNARNEHKNKLMEINFRRQFY